MGMMIGRRAAVVFDEDGEMKVVFWRVRVGFDGGLGGDGMLGVDGEVEGDGLKVGGGVADATGMTMLRNGKYNIHVYAHHFFMVSFPVHYDRILRARYI